MCTCNQREIYQSPACIYTADRERDLYQSPACIAIRSRQHPHVQRGHGLQEQEHVEEHDAEVGVGIHTDVEHQADYCREERAEHAGQNVA